MSRKYDEYLRSDWWQKRRQRALRLGGHECRKCGKTKGLHVHHKTYKNLGEEKDEDLEVLCKACHRHVHRRQEVRASKRRQKRRKRRRRKKRRKRRRERKKREAAEAAERKRWRQLAKKARKKRNLNPERVAAWMDEPILQMFAEIRRHG